MAYFVGLHVSLNEVSVYLMDMDGRVIARGTILNGDRPFPDPMNQAM